MPAYPQLSFGWSRPLSFSLSLDPRVTAHGGRVSLSRRSLQLHRAVHDRSNCALPRRDRPDRNAIGIRSIGRDDCRAIRRDQHRARRIPDLRRTRRSRCRRLWKHLDWLRGRRHFRRGDRACFRGLRHHAALESDHNGNSDHAARFRTDGNALSPDVRLNGSSFANLDDAAAVNSDVVIDSVDWTGAVCSTSCHLRPVLSDPAGLVVALQNPFGTGSPGCGRKPGSRNCGGSSCRTVSVCSNSVRRIHGRSCRRRACDRASRDIRRRDVSRPRIHCDCNCGSRTVAPNRGGSRSACFRSGECSTVPVPIDGLGPALPAIPGAAISADTTGTGRSSWTSQSSRKSREMATRLDRWHAVSRATSTIRIGTPPGNPPGTRRYAFEKADLSAVIVVEPDYNCGPARRGEPNSRKYLACLERLFRSSGTFIEPHPVTSIITCSFGQYEQMLFSRIGFFGYSPDRLSHENR